MHRILRATLVLLSVWLLDLRDGYGQEHQSYALLIAVTSYEHAAMNEPALAFPEADARAVGQKLSSFGYEVSYLLGQKATQANILSALEALGTKGIPDGGILVGLWGHGVRYDNEDYFCPYNTKIRNAKDNDGNELLATEPDPASAVGIHRLFKAVQLCNSKHRIIIADCCRNSPNAARGRGFGSELSTTVVPVDTAVIYACKAYEQAYEHEKWGHGAFTKALLDCLNSESKKSSISASSLFSPLEEKVDELVRAVTSKKQSVSPKLDGNPKLFVKNSLKKAIQPEEPPRQASMQNNAKAQEKRGSLLLKTTGIQVCSIPAGQFMMGSDESSEELERARIFGEAAFMDERPVRKVSISGFYLGIAEVTKGQFRQFVSETGYVTEAEADGKGGGGFNGNHLDFNWKRTGFSMADDQPVVNVSWNDAMKFCAWVSKKDGVKARLPTEAEWEYACRAGSTTRYATGDDPNSLFHFANVREARFNKLSGIPPGASFDFDDSHPFTSPVGTYKANGFGLFDMHGNVEEWCSDWYASNYDANALIDPLGPATGTDRVARGPGFNASPRTVRVTCRGHNVPSYRNCNRGFRIALSR